MTKNENAFPYKKPSPCVAGTLCCRSGCAVHTQCERAHPIPEKAEIPREDCQTAATVYSECRGTGELKVLVGEGYLADSLQYIPFSDSKCFELDATTQLSRSGRQIPLMECKASYTDYLRGLNEHYIATLIEKANTAGRWPGLKIGDIEKPNHHAGNWE